MAGRLRVAALVAATALMAAACAGPGVGGSTVTSTPEIPTTTDPETTTTTRVVAVPNPGATTSSTAPPSTMPPTTTTLPQSAACERFTGPEAVGALSEPDIDEASGLAASRRHPGLFWIHNDSGNPAEVWAIGPDGAVVARIGLPMDNVDWEDVAMGAATDGRDLLYIADTGDNRSERPSVDLYRLPEPPRVDRTLEEGDVQRLRVTYEGGAIDVEALFIDPDTGDAYLISKQAAGDASLFVIPASAWEGRAAEAVQVAVVELGAADLVTGADISPDGTVIAVRTYTRVMLWDRPAGTPIPEAMTGAPCDLPPPDDGQGEAIAITDEGVFTVSEGVGSPVHRYPVSG